MIKTAIRIILFLILAIAMGESATRSDINTIEATENIRYLSQKIAKNYLYLYSRPHRTDLKEQLHKMAEELGENFNTIAASTRDTDTKDLLQYLEYNRANILDLLGKNVTRDGAFQMLDYSEILLEGAESISHKHRYEFNPEETMLMHIKKYEYLTERLGKFYMASSLGALSRSNRKKMKESEKALNEGLSVIQAYHYPSELEKQKGNLAHFWKSSHYFLTHTHDMFIPSLIIETSAWFEKILAQLALYHSKNQ